MGLREIYGAEATSPSSNEAATSQPCPQTPWRPRASPGPRSAAMTDIALTGGGWAGGPGETFARPRRHFRAFTGPNWRGLKRLLEASLALIISIDLPRTCRLGQPVYPSGLPFGIPRTSSSIFGTIIHAGLQWGTVLLEPHRGRGGAVAPVATLLLYDFWRYIEILWRTILMAHDRDTDGAGCGPSCSVSRPAANLAPQQLDLLYSLPVSFEILPRHPESCWPLGLRFHDQDRPACGSSPFRRFHTAGVRLCKLFSRRVNERLPARPVEGFTAVGGTWAEKDALGRRSAGCRRTSFQLTPNAALTRSNVRACVEFIGSWGAGGIGQEA